MVTIDSVRPDVPVELMSLEDLLDDTPIEFAYGSTITRDLYVPGDRMSFLDANNAVSLRGVLGALVFAILFLLMYDETYTSGDQQPIVAMLFVLSLLTSYHA